MVYAFFRGGLAAMAALLVEIFIATFTSSLPNAASLSFASQPTIDSGTFLIAMSALIEETAMFVSLFGLTFPTALSRRAFFLGASAGIGFSFFEASVKILFLGSNQNVPLLSGIASGSILHIVTGALLGFSILFWRRENRPFSFLLFLIAIAVHFLYNLSLAPILVRLP